MRRFPTTRPITARACVPGPGTRGFTLLELIIYIGILSMVLVSAALFVAEFAAISVKAAQYRDVQRNARLAVHRIEVELREADGVNVGASSFDVNPGVLSLQTGDPGTDPTVFSVTDGVLYVQQGSGPQLPLTSSKLEIRDFTVENLSVAGRTRLVRTTLTVGAVNPSGFQDVEAEITMYASGRVRVGDGFSN